MAWEDAPSFDTKLTAPEEQSFRSWKQKYAPNDSGADYDLRGAFKAGLTPDEKTGHWPDTFKKPNHPTFSNESQYAKDAPDLAGHWEGQKYVPPGKWESAPEPAPEGRFDKVHEAARAAAQAGRELVDVGSGVVNLMSWIPRAAAAVPLAAATAPFMRPESAITGQRTSLADAFKEALAGHTETGHIPYIGEATTPTLEGTKIPKMEATEYLIGKAFEKAGELAKTAGEKTQDVGGSPLAATAVETGANALAFLAPFAKLPKSKGAQFADALNQDVAAREVPTPEPMKPDVTSPNVVPPGPPGPPPAGVKALKETPSPLVQAMLDAANTTYRRSPNATPERIVQQGAEQQHRGAGEVVQGEGIDRNVAPVEPAQGNAASGGDRVQQAATREQVAEQLKPRIEKAKTDHPEYSQYVEDLAGKLDRPAFIAPVKGFDRALDKAMSDYEGDPSQVSDLLRSTIVVDSPKEVGAVMKKISETAPVVKTRNLYNVTTSGYRDGLAKVKLNGDVTEIQANTPEMVGAKEQAHPLYELMDGIVRKAKDENRDLTAPELQMVKTVTNRMKEIYNDAHTRNSARLAAGGNLGKNELQSMAAQLMQKGQEAGRAERKALESSSNLSLVKGSSEPGLGARPTREPSQDLTTPLSKETGKESPSSQYSTEGSVARDFEKSLGMERGQMPQISRHEHERFREFAKSMKVKVEPGTARLSELTPAQKHYNPKQVEQMPDHALQYPTLVSSDNYILDGANRFATQRARGVKTINVMRIDLPARRALALMEAFDRVGKKEITDIGRKPLPVTSLAAEAADLVRRRGGKIVGAFGGDLAEVEQALGRMDELARKGEHGKDWYKESADAIIKAFGDDKEKSDRFAMMLAIASAGTEVKANFTMAVKALEQFSKGEPIKIATGQKNKSMSDFLYDGVMPDSIKVLDFYKSLSEHITGIPATRAVTDRWQFRISSGDKARDKGTAQQYEHTSKLAEETAKRLGWTQTQAQAAMWVAMKAQTKFESMMASVRDSKASKYANMSFEEMKKAAMEFARVSFASEIEVRGWKPPEGLQFLHDQTGFRDQTQTPEFKRWFGDSKVVDENGNPQVVYHGTRAGSDFSSFNTERSESGSHFGTKEQADSFVRPFPGKAPLRENARVIPVYLSIKNPLRLIDYGDFDPLGVAHQMVDKKILSRGEAGSDPSNRDIHGLLDEYGYDGIVYLNRREGINAAADYRFNEMSDKRFKETFPDATDSYIALRPEQVKSAIGNRGTFDPAKQSIVEVDDMASQMFDQLQHMNKKARDLGLRDAEQLHQEKPREFNRIAEEWRNQREQNALEARIPKDAIDRVSISTQMNSLKEAPQKVRDFLDDSPLPSEHTLIIADALTDLHEAGFPEHFLDAVNGMMQRGEGAPAEYNLVDRKISIRHDLLNAAFSGEGEVGPLNHTHLIATMRGWLAHEQMHGIDDPGGESVLNFISAKSSRLEMGMVGKHYPILVPKGDIAKEAMQAWETGHKSEEGGLLKQFLSYPLSSNFSIGESFQVELFAQLGRLYHTNPKMMERRLPIAYDAFKEIFDNAGTTVEETRSAVRKTLRASGTVARDQGAVGRADQGVRRGAEDQRVPEDGEAGRRVERLSASDGFDGSRSDAAHRLKAAFAGRGSPPKIPEGGVPPDGGGGPPLFVRQVNPAVTARMTSLAREWFKENPSERDRNLLISDDVQRHVWGGDIGADYLKRFGLTKEDFSRALRDTVADSARTMAYYSHIFRDMKLSQEDLETLKKSGVPEDALYIRPWWRRIQDLWRSLLVTQMATAARNGETQGVRLALDGITEALDAGIQRLLGRKNPTSPLAGFDVIMKIFTRNKGAIDEILKGHPTQRDRLFANYMSDVAVPRGVIGGAFDKGMTALEKGANVLNFFNRFQEFAIRRGVFQAKLDQYLEQKGYSLEDMIKRNQLGRIPRDAIEHAVDKALIATFAETPAYGSIPKLLIDVANRIPLAALAIPFPRFMYNSMKYLYQYSPLGILSYLGPKERAAFAAGDTSAISKAVVGAGLLTAAFAFRNSDNAGEKWYEYKTDDGKIVDLRPFNPFAAYLFTADLIKKYKEGTLYKLTPQDIAQGVLSSNMRAGTGLYLLDNFLNNYFGQTGDEKKFITKVKELGGNLAAGFFTPFAQLRDVYDQFTQGYSDVKETKEEPVLGPIKRQLPVKSQELPDASFPTREGPKRTLNPLLRQLTGIGLQSPKNSFEGELDRLGFTQRDVIAPSGEADIDQKYKALMGKLSEMVFVPLVDSSAYQKMTDAQKGVILDEMMNTVAADVKKGVNASLPPEKQVDIVLRHESPRIKILLKQAGVLQ